MLKRLNNQSGASLVFVLAAMLMLLSIGGSAMAAATSSRGAVLEKRALNQLHLLADSVQKTVGSQLTGNMSDVAADTVPNNRRLARLIYDEIANDVMNTVFGPSDNPLPTPRASKPLYAGAPPYVISSPTPQLSFNTTLNIQLPSDFQLSGTVLPDGSTDLPVTLRVRYEAAFSRYRGERWQEIEHKNYVYDDEGFLTDIIYTYTYEKLADGDEVIQFLNITNCEVTVDFNAIIVDRSASNGSKRLDTSAIYELPQVTFEWDPPAINKDYFAVKDPTKFNPYPYTFVEIVRLSNGIELKAQDKEECSRDKRKIINVDAKVGRAVSYEKR